MRGGLSIWIAELECMGQKIPLMRLMLSMEQDIRTRRLSLEKSTVA
jgi:hypothetical protein